MAALVLGQLQVRRLLPMQECMDLVSDALRALAAGRAGNPLRWGYRIEKRNAILGMMPGYLDRPGILGIKTVAVFPGNHGTRYDSHQGVVLLFDPRHGTPLAVLDASEITAIRTAAASGVATRALARDDAGDLALLGSGVQARTHLEAMLLVRRVRRVRVFSPDRGRREAFARTGSRRHGVRVEPCETAREAVGGADLICTVTSSRTPVLEGAWLAPGAHVNAVGSSVASARELDTVAVTRSRLYVDRRESALSEAGDFLFPKREGAVGDDHIVGEIGEVLLGAIPGRKNDEDITVFESLGLAVEDLAAAQHVYARAREEGEGVEVDLGGVRDAPA